MASSEPAPVRFDGVRVVFFDFMGTCLNWHENIVRSLPSSISLKKRSELAIAWREAFFRDIHVRFEQKLPPEDIDVTHGRCLEALLDHQDFAGIGLSPQNQEDAVKAWHRMAAWPDIPAALARLREKYEVFVLANGTTRLQLDLARSSALRFDMMFSSQLLGLTKPDPEIYRKALSLVGVEPDEALMVAAHAYDLKAAKKVGMRTVYIRRWTEDTKEDFQQVAQDVDLFLGGLEPGCTGELDGNLSALVDALCRR
jgi:2-haloalkanoic acid dehalogenase type II